MSALSESALQRLCVIFFNPPANCPGCPLTVAERRRVGHPECPAKEATP